VVVDKKEMNIFLILVAVGVGGLVAKMIYDRIGVPYIPDEGAFDPVAMKKVVEKIKSADYFPRIVRASADYGLDWRRVASIIAVESAGNVKAVGAAGEVGLMQLMPGAIQDVYRQWGSSYEVALVTGANFFDPLLNIQIGTTYLWILYDRLKNLNDATMRYNGVGVNTVLYLGKVLKYEKYF